MSSYSGFSAISQKKKTLTLFFFLLLSALSDAIDKAHDVANGNIGFHSGERDASLEEKKRNRTNVFRTNATQKMKPENLAN